MVGSQSIETLNGFCHFKLWDPYLTWEYTPFPDLTPCFQYTVLAMLPMLVFVISFPLELLFSVKTYSGIIPWNSNNLTKLVLTLILVLINCFQVLLTCFHSSLDDVPSAAAFTSPFIKLITFVLLAYSEHKRRKVGITSSGAQSIFWLLEFFASSLIYQSNINHLLFKESIIPNIHLLQIHILTVPITFARFLLCFKADHRPLYTLEDDSCPESWSSYFSKLVYYWFNPLITAGFKKPLQQDDLWDLSSDKTSDEILEDFEKYWKKELFKAKSSGWDTSLLASEQKPNVKYPSIFYPLLRAFWPSVLTALLQKLSSDTLNLVRPLMLGCLINFVARQEPLWKGFLYSIFLLSATELQSIVLSLYTLKTSVIGMKIKIALTSEIYKKALVISNEEKQKSTLGEIVNLMALDTQRFMDLMPLLLVLVSAPFQISLILYFLSLKLGKAVIGGLLLMMLMIPVNTIVAVFMKKYQTKNMELKDDRTKLINEVLSGIKVIKFHAWEVPFSRIITKIRDAEVKILKIIAYFIACLNFIWNCTPFLISLVSFGLFVMISDDNILTADVAFVSLTLFQLLRAPLNLLPSVISLLVQSMVSIKRIDKFLQSKNLNPNHFKRSKKKGSDAVVIESASYSWSSQHEDPVLKNINLNVPKGKLVAVVGKVGSGKSSLLSSILGELNKCNGNIKLEGSVAYIPQTAWIQNATLIDNIIMFKPFNKTLYSHTIEACALVPDLNVLPGGDRTEIGEKGINLSGGQKQRVSLARSVYQNADIYLLDDPLSAVDAHVGKHIFENVIGPNGILKNKTRIFVTNNISYLSQCDMVVVLKDKTVAMKGTYNELIKKYNEFEKLVSTNSQTQVQNDEEENDCADDLSNSFESKLIKTETAEVFRVKSKVYTTYLKKIGLKISFAILSIQMLSEVCAVARNLWLSDWSNDAIHFKGIVNHEVQNIRFIVYGAIGIGQGLSTLFGALFLAYGSMKASKALHEMMLSNTLSSPMSFFDTTPIGRIVNRFSKDVNVLDMNIMGNFRLWLVILLQVFSTLCVTVIAIPYIIIIIIPTSIFYYMVQIRYIASSRQLKRLESISRSPIYSHFSETIVGASSIRAYDFVNTFIRQLHKKIDENNKSFYLSVIASRWLAIRLEFIANIITFFVALLVVINKQRMNPGEVGLVLTYVFTLTTCLNTLVTQTALVETDIVSVERMLEYCNLPSEAPWDQDLDRCQRTWPKHGKISFQSYSTRYRPGLDLVLKDINIDINGGEKIGICGRTGAGKSSLILAILRLVEAHKGKILIDGVDISKLGLHKIRSSITIIPQDPVLFSGTVRNNLDPFENYNDSELWNILEHVNMKTYFRKQSGGLDFIIGEGGENLSTGQRQLLCLARAMLCDSKILVLDEATAGIDHTTDKLIQETLRREFADCTVLTIAHRLNTIIDDSTRVLVLDNGEVAEFDTVDNLLARKNIFYDMAIDAGIVD